MTEKGHQFESRRKASLDGKRKFNLEVPLFKKLIVKLRSHNVIKKKLQALKVLADNASQEFLDCLNLATDPGEISKITSKKAGTTYFMGENLCQSFTSSGLIGFESRIKIALVPRISKAKSFKEICTKPFVLRPAKTPCLVPQPNLPCSNKDYVFSESVKDQEKALSKLIIQQELSETLTEEGVYREALDEDNQESRGELDLQHPTGFGNIIDT